MGTLGDACITICCADQEYEGEAKICVVNLVDEPWLPAQRPDGRRELVSLRTALLEAHELRGLALSTPTLMPAVLRQTLLPLLLWGLGAPRTEGEWQERFSNACFTGAERQTLTACLDRERAGFELFDAARPFAQVAGLEALSGETKPVSLLIPSVATGNNVPLFTAFNEAHPLVLSVSDAALWLLHAHCWDTAAIKTGAQGDPEAEKGKGKTTGNPTGPLGRYGVVVPEGRTLFETLLLNSPIVPDGLATWDDPRPGGDRPQWVVEEPAGPDWSTRPALGILDALTWQSRRMRLVPQTAEDGTTRVARVVVSAGDRLASVRPEFEWHTAWTYTAKPKKGQLPLRPRTHRQHEHAWQGLAALLALRPEEPDKDGPRTSGLLQQIGDLQATGHLPEELPLQVRTCGLVYGNQSAVIEDAVADALPLPTMSLVADTRTRFEVLDGAEKVEQAARALDRLSADLRRAEGAEPLPRDKGQRPAATFLQNVDAPMRRLLRGLQKDAADDTRIDEGMGAWEEILWRLVWDTADELLAAASPTSFLGRTTEQGTSTFTFRAATARASFARAVRAILTRAAERRCNESDDEGEM